MKWRGFNLVEVAVVVVILGVLASVLFPPSWRPLLWSQTPMPALSFKNAELQTVVGRLHQELATRRKMTFLKRVRWESESLKHRRISLNTKADLTLRQVLSLVGSQAGVAFDSGGGNCGTCAYPIGGIAVVEMSKKTSPRKKIG